MTDPLHDRLRAVLDKGPALHLAILFGSRARGTAQPGSDVDVAILPLNTELTLAQEHALADALEQTAGAPVDLVRLDHASAALRWRIARDAVVLVSHPPEAAKRFLARAGIEHDEVRELEADAMRRFRVRLAALGQERS